MWRARWLRLLLVIAVSVAVAACLPDQGDLDAIKALPAASLPPPAGAVEVDRQERPRQWRGVMNGWENAYVQTAYATNASFSDVLAYYAAALEGDGWTARNPKVPGDFIKERFLLSVYDITNGSSWSPPSGYAIVFNVEIHNLHQ
jgi:hypothetical protein